MCRFNAGINALIFNTEIRSNIPSSPTIISKSLNIPQITPSPNSNKQKRSNRFKQGNLKQYHRVHCEERNEEDEEIEEENGEEGDLAYFCNAMEVDAPFHKLSEKTNSIGIDEIRQYARSLVYSSNKFFVDKQKSMMELCDIIGIPDADCAFFCSKWEKAITRLMSKIRYEIKKTIHERMHCEYILCVNCIKVNYRKLERR